MEVTTTNAETTPVVEPVATPTVTTATSVAKVEKSTVTELQKIIQKLEKLEKMINPNSKKSLILWEEDNSFKNLISSIVSYATTCDTKEFPIELLDRLKALSSDVENQITEGTAKVEELTKQAKLKLLYLKSYFSIDILSHHNILDFLCKYYSYIALDMWLKKYLLFYILIYSQVLILNFVHG